MSRVPPVEPSPLTPAQQAALWARIDREVARLEPMAARLVYGNQMLDAGDLLQDARLKLWHALRCGREVQHWRTYAGHALRRSFVDALRNAKTRVRDDVPLDDLLVSLHPTVMDDHGDQALVKELAHALTTEELLLLRMSGDEWEYKDMAAALAMPVGTVRSRLHYARLKAQLVVQDCWLPT